MTLTPHQQLKLLHEQGKIGYDKYNEVTLRVVPLNLSGDIWTYDVTFSREFVADIHNIHSIDPLEELAKIAQVEADTKYERYIRNQGTK